ncbi:MAG: rhodanese-like domain-containing protein [Hyphomicrobiaceae bacterium]
MLQLSILIRSCRLLPGALLVAAGLVSWPCLLLAGTADQSPSTSVTYLKVERAYQLSLARKIHLIDIRRPSEWRQTGIPRTATPITMHQGPTAFFSQLRDVTKSAPQLPVALICAHGHRSKYMQKVLARYGYANIIDVGEGMLGSQSGPGWLKSGLPTQKWTSAATQ